ncbi:DnaE-like DNA polymerase III [Microbacterium phage Gilda]|uniref:DnaE-like DNA polymerase III n=1 Tax=Microbacterium phage Gilda TaxID=2772024 RepID=A0A7L7SZG2_9CAUD|nr:DnaE-like DNA polymerase III [Microbacterium phage Gilda]
MQMTDTATPVDTRTILRHWLNEGWKYREMDKRIKEFRRKDPNHPTRQDYIDRVNYEFDLMDKKDFLDYFAVLGDVVRQAKDMGVAVGPARGSAAASLCCFLWRITEVNPLEYPLMLFERFIDINRNDVPDIDLDFEDDRRDEVRQIMIRKYGIDRVGNIGTFTRYRGKNAIDDVARVYSIPKYRVETAKEFLVERSGGDSRQDASIGDTVEMFPQVKEVFDEFPDLYRSIELEGNYKSFGVHAAGLVIGNDALDNYVASYTKKVGSGATEKSVRVLSVDKYDGEHLGLMKLDALGLSTMGMIRKALDMLGMSLEQLYDIPMDDPETLAAFERADVTGIFQFEGRTMKLVTQELKPKVFMDLAAVNALARPGPLHSGSTGDYIAYRFNRKEREELHPIVTRICAATEGQIIYQEQILQICREMGQFPYADMGRIRKVISSKLGEAAANEFWEQFREGAVSQGIPEKTAAATWKRIVTAGTYSFNIAHCVSYSMLGFWAMWLKVHHPLEFYAAQLQKTDDADKQVVLMRDMQDKRFGRSYKVLPPALGESGVTWTPVEGGVRAGYMQIPGIGEKTAEKIVEREAEIGGFQHWEELSSTRGGIKGIGPKTVEKIKAFAENEDPFGIMAIVNATNEIMEAIDNDDIPGVPQVTTNADEVPYEAIEGWRGVILGRLKNRNLQDMFENHRSRTGDELDPSTVKDPHLKDSVTLYLEDTAGTLTVKVNRRIYPKFKAMIWDAKIGHDYVLASVFKYPFLGKTIHIDNMWVIDPD